MPRRTDGLGERASIALVAAGSGNALAGSFGLNAPKTLTDKALLTAQAILSGHSQSFDVFKVSYPDGRPPMYCNLILSWGNTTALFRMVENLRQKYRLGNSRYVIGVLYRLLWRNYPGAHRLAHTRTQTR